MAKPAANLGMRIGRRLKLRDLQILSTVVDRGSMARGAAHLGISQPAVSDAIANLEDALGVRLLDRSPRGVEPTIYGRAILKRGHVVFDELRQGLRDIEYLTDPSVGEVRIACPESLSAGFVPDIIDRLSRKRPRVGVYVVESQTAEQEFRELRERSVDLMLGRLLKPLIDDDVDMEVLCEDRFLVAAGAASPWASRRKIALEELIGERWILFPDSNVTTTYVSKLFRASGLEQPRGIVGSFSMHLRMHLLATGRFVTIMQASVLRYNAARWGLKELPVDLRTRAAPIVLFTLKERTRSPLVEEFIEHARRAARPKK